MVPEAPLRQTEHGLVAAGEGWFVLNARAAGWRHREGKASLPFEGETDFPQVGIAVVVLEPGEPGPRTTRWTPNCENSNSPSSWE
jgi:hypothetical protein